MAVVAVVWKHCSGEVCLVAAAEAGDRAVAGAAAADLGAAVASAEVVVVLVVVEILVAEAPEAVGNLWLRP